MILTKSRKKILDALESKKIYSAKELHLKLNDFDLATIYRNLNYFVQQGIINELNIKKDEVLYELKEDNHQHAVCNKCGKIYHIDIDEKAIKKALKLTKFKIEDIEISIRGHCD